MPINIPTAIKELKENATEEQRKTLSILEGRFYECVILKEQLEIAVKALEEYADEWSWDSTSCNGNGYYEEALYEQHGYKEAKEALKKIKELE